VKGIQLDERVWIVGSGAVGFALTDAYDCHVYLVDGGSELALVDVGAGMGAEAIVANVRDSGFDPSRIRHVLLTHAHGDHAGGAARMRALLDSPATYVSRVVAQYVRDGDERGTSIDVARAAGIYPADYRLEPCPVDVELSEGDEVAVGDLTVRVLDTPGHSDGHVSLVLDRDGRRALFAGDVVFFGGNIFLQNLHDCRLDAHIESLRRLRGLEVTSLFPGHLTVDLREGQRHIEKANDALDRLLVPNQLFNAW
jgi:glyoxylase-like metal-dependent hydrolase (beta-lactamase superfamily II)